MHGVGVRARRASVGQDVQAGISVRGLRAVYQEK